MRVVISEHFAAPKIRITAGLNFSAGSRQFFGPGSTNQPTEMADKLEAVQDVQTLSDDAASEDLLAEDTSSKKRKATGAAAHRCLKRVEEKRVRLTNEQKAKIAIYADEHRHLSRDDVTTWAVSKYDLKCCPASAFISSLWKPEKVNWAENYLVQETVTHKLQETVTHKLQITLNLRINYSYGSLVGWKQAKQLLQTNCSERKHLKSLLN